ncbi:N-6 DNA methylase [Olsenella urininfantis]|uniref:N-6 DNA methylase n=1 Tax=Olsenella urininfantis TaxID=1871033 RepID=UPI001F316196|nr:N-6 DNA methylase [Olsenella urininfantis]
MFGVQFDPACGTGGFLGEAYLQVSSQINEADAARWANARLYGVDLDDINVKLAGALMVGMGDGSTHIKLGNSIRQSKWQSNRRGLEDAIDDDGYDVVLTNPLFGQNLTVNTAEASA